MNNFNGFILFLLYNSENLFLKIFKKLIELSKKVNKIERHLNELDNKINELYNLLVKNNFILFYFFFVNMTSLVF